MKKLLLVCLLGLTLSQVFCSEEEKKDDNVTKEEIDGIPYENKVIVLSDENFEKVLKSHEFVLVEFYAPWCGHCKSLAPEYDKAAQKLVDIGSKVKLAKLDATIHTEAAKEHKIQGFPTLKFFKSGVVIDYQGPRNAEGIVQWVEKKTGPAAVDLKSSKETEKLIDEKEVVVVGFFKDQKSDDAKKFLDVASAHDDISFGITSSEDLIKHFKTKDGKAVMFKKFDEKRADFDGDFAKDFEKFVKTESMPLVVEFSQENAPKIFGNEIKSHFLMVISKKDEKTEGYIQTLSEIAKDFKGKAIFVTIDGDIPSHAQVLEYFGFTSANIPVYLMFATENQKKYIADNKQTINKDEIKKFVDEFFAGKLTPFLKSEEIPEDWNEEGVKVLVGKNFESVAMDKSKDVFVEFYAPWCGHCKSLEPIWAKLGEKYKDHESIVIAKMDSTANEVESVTIQGFPTLKLFKKETNEIVDYTGGRDFDSLVTFLETGKIKEPEVDKDTKTEEPKEKKEEKKEKKEKKDKKEKKTDKKKDKEEL